MPKVPFGISGLESPSQLPQTNFKNFESMICFVCGPGLLFSSLPSFSSQQGRPSLVVSLSVILQWCFAYQKPHCGRKILSTFGRVFINGLCFHTPLPCTLLQHFGQDINTLGGAACSSWWL